MTLEELIQFAKQALEKINPDKRVYTEFRFTVEQVALLLVCLEDYKQIKTDYIDIDKQLRTANTENDELKRLLADAMDVLYNVPCDGICSYCHLDEKCKWRHHDEAMELLGGNENDND